MRDVLNKCIRGKELGEKRERTKQIKTIMKREENNKKNEQYVLSVRMFMQLRQENGEGCCGNSNTPKHILI